MRDEVLKQVSVIVPVAPAENLWTRLLLDLRDLPAESEILIASPEQPNEDLLNRVRGKLKASIHWVVSEKGRAKQMNAAAKMAKNNYLWFVHSDTRFGAEALSGLSRALIEDPISLCYFDLHFGDDGPKLMKLNNWGVMFRSRVLRMPFGDQAFCLPKHIFWKLGGYDEGVSCAEDHHLIWQAHKGGIQVRSVGVFIKTSARKYTRSGWAHTTWNHVRLTVEQATPHVLDLIKEKVRRP
ncbi:MAG: glycosyltransferase [Bdellovibrionales bacterium]|nr:glycosyltransferase [Bdellovibrionales bacterium]